MKRDETIKRRSLDEVERPAAMKSPTSRGLAPHDDTSFTLASSDVPDQSSDYETGSSFSKKLVRARQLRRTSKRQMSRAMQPSAAHTRRGTAATKGSYVPSRILANRQSAARSKERRRGYVIGLEQDVKLLALKVGEQKQHLFQLSSHCSLLEAENMRLSASASVMDRKMRACDRKLAMGCTRPDQAGDSNTAFDQKWSVLPPTGSVTQAGCGTAQAPNVNPVDAHGALKPAACTSCAVPADPLRPKQLASPQRPLFPDPLDEWEHLMNCAETPYKGNNANSAGMPSMIPRVRGGSCQTEPDHTSVRTSSMPGWLPGGTAASIKPMFRQGAVVTTPAIDVPGVTLPAIKTMPAVQETVAATHLSPYDKWCLSSGFGSLGFRGSCSPVRSVPLAIASAELTTATFRSNVPPIRPADAGEGFGETSGKGNSNQLGASSRRATHPGGADNAPNMPDGSSHQEYLRTLVKKYAAMPQRQLGMPLPPQGRIQDTATIRLAIPSVPMHIHVADPHATTPPQQQPFDSKVVVPATRGSRKKMSQQATMASTSLPSFPSIPDLTESTWQPPVWTDDLVAELPDFSAADIPMKPSAPFEF